MAERSQGALAALRSGAISVLVVLCMLGSTAHADSPQGNHVLLDQARIFLGDLSDSDFGEAATLDLGPTPPPGGSRIISRTQIQRALNASGQKADLSAMPATVRVASAFRVIKPAELVKEVEPRLDALLKKGVSLQKVKITRSLKVAPRSRVGQVHRPRIPRREGVHRLTTTVGIMTDGAETQRVSVGYSVSVSAEGARPDVERGAEVALVIQRGAARISASARALSDADIGEVVSFRVEKTRAVLRARLVSKDQAEVVGK